MMVWLIVVVALLDRLVDFGHKDLVPVRAQMSLKQFNQLMVAAKEK